MASQSLPSLGPAWAGSLMGTSIAVTMTQIHHVPVLPWILLALATSIFCALVVGFARSRKPGLSPESMGPWGMTAMGIMALGSAWNGLVSAPSVQFASWIVGVVLGLYTCLDQLRGFPGKPAFTWGLALVAPMVAATSGGQLAAAYGLWTRVVGIICFLCALLLAVPLFVYVYWSRPSLEPAVAGTAWVPLGIVGQSTAAVHVLFSQSFADAYGWTFLIIGVPAVVYALVVFGRSILAWAPYSPGWWGSTFPVGTLSLGTHCMGWDMLSFAFMCLLVFHVVLGLTRWETSSRVA